MSNTTRYLCAAGYLDTRFREAVLEEELVRDPYRGVAPRRATSTWCRWESSTACGRGG